MRKVAETKDAPVAIGPYSQAVVYEGKLIFCSGQIGLDPQTGELVAGDVEAQTKRAMENLKAVLESQLSGMDRVLKTTIYLLNITDFASVNSVYAEYVGDKPPARATVEVNNLPKGALVEIECIAEAI